MHNNNVCDFTSISSTLRELDISKNNRFPNLSLLNNIFERCVDLRKLCINGTGLSQEKLDATSFHLISEYLEDFDCSDNDQIK